MDFQIPKTPQIRIDLDWMPPSALAILAMSFREAADQNDTLEISEEWLILAQEVEAALYANNETSPQSMMPKVASSLPHLFKE